MKLIAEFFEQLWPDLPDMELIAAYYDKIPPDGRVLEMGCGPGRTLVPGLLRNLYMTGIDLDSDMVRVARERLSGGSDRFNVIQGNFLDFSEKGAFDLVLCVQNTLLMVKGDDNRRKLFNVAFDSLKPGGFFIVWILSEGPWGNGREMSFETAQGPLDFSSRVENGPGQRERAIIYDLSLNHGALCEQHRIDMELMSNQQLLGAGLLAGFEVAAAYGDFSGKSALDANATAPTVVFRKPLLP